jgi:hypothetical protein
MDLKEIGWEGVDWKDLAKDRNKFWTVFNAVMNRRFNKMGGGGNSCLDEELLASREGLLHGASIYE